MITNDTLEIKGKDGADLSVLLLEGTLKVLQ